MSSSSSSSLSSVVCSHFSLDEIKEATNNFDLSNVLGHGGEAVVYLGHITVGKNRENFTVAVKRLNPNSIEFEKEIEIVSKIRHPNLVSLLGYCDESNQKILVYEYMERGSLSDYLKKKISICLSWKQRLNICLGVARGLQYLHTTTDEWSRGIIHRDMKPANILLDKNWVAKVSDFGMFKLSHADQTNSSMLTALKGTSGYYAPEYIKYGLITRKIDVYAFGVVLFEVLCGKRPWDRGEDESYYITDDEDFGVWAQQNVDVEINGEISGDSLKIFADIIRSSLQQDPGGRLSMDEVVMDLERALKCHEDHEGFVDIRAKDSRICANCNLLISDDEYFMSKNHPIHMSCYNERFILRAWSLRRSRWGKRKDHSTHDAAVLIQSTFRTFLLKRCRVLRELRELEIAKTGLKELRGLSTNYSYRGRVARDTEERKRFSEKIIVLFLTVDAIEGADLMVRAAKKSMMDELEAMLVVFDPQPQVGGSSLSMKRMIFDMA